jgi:predicted Zn-dependent peptidase
MTSPRAKTTRLAAPGSGVVTRTVLPGGLRIITEAMTGVRSAAVGIWTPVGSRDENQKQAGASHFLEHLLFKGTPTRSALEISSSLEAVGGEFNAFTEKEHTCYYATVLDRDLALAVDVIADVVLNATISAQDVEVERSVVLEEIAMRDDDPSDLVHDVFASALLGDTPLGRPILGTVESMTALNRTQVNNYYRKRYTTESMVVSVAGNVEHAEVVRLVRKAFSDRLDASKSSSAPRAGRIAKAAAPVRHVGVVQDDTEQANIVLGGHGYSRHDPRRFVLGVLSAALGGGMSSRLFQRIREERGLAYSVYSFLNSYSDDGIFGVYAGCQPGKAEEVIGLMLAELEAVANGGLSEEEIERGKGQMRGGLVLGLENSEARMSRIGKSEITYGDVLGVDDILAEVDAVTAGDIAEVAAEVLTRPRALTVVGPFGSHDFDGMV